MNTEQPGDSQPQPQHPVQYPVNGSGGGAPHPQYVPQRTGGRGPLWPALVALSAGVVCIVLNFVPGMTVIRFVLNGCGILFAIAGIVLAIVSLNKRWWTGLSIAGLIVSAFAVLLAGSFLGLGILANHQLEASAQRAQDMLDEKLAKEKAAEDTVLDESQWLEDARKIVDPADYTEVDAAQLSEIMADPDAYAEQGIIVSATMATPMNHSGFAQQGLCLTSVTLLVSGETPDLSQRAGILDRGTEYECPLADQLLGLDEESDDLVGSQSEEYRMWLVRGGTTKAEDGEEMPVFVLMRLEE
ncbi:MAG: hypothetical protein ACTHV4_00600 [Canibacter sp.]